jgi:cyclophilin family peptidyl-prolyl cis-trans isomerase
MRHQPTLWLVPLLLVAACGGPPPPVLVPAPTYELKVAWMIDLEDRRVLRAVPAAPAAEAGPRAAAGAAPTGAAAAPALPTPDLERLMGDADARIRRRAAIAAGRVGLAEAIPALRTALADADPDVRQAAAFGLGLLGDAEAADALSQALGDVDPGVQGRAAEALGLVGATGAAPAVAAMVKAHLDRGALTGLAPDEDGPALSPAVEAVRLGLGALVRLKAYDALETAVLADGRLPRSYWWPVAFAFQRIGDPRAIPVLRLFARADGVYGRAFAIRGLGELKDADSAADFVALVEDENQDLRVRVAALRALTAFGDARARPAVTRLLSLYAALDRGFLLEVVTAAGVLSSPASTELLLDLLADRWPPVRAAVLKALATTDPFTFTTVLSSLDEDPDWRVRAALAEAMTHVEAEHSTARLRQMLDDPDARVLPAVLRALAAVGASDVDAALSAHLTHADAVVRATAARLLAERETRAAAPALLTAYEASRDEPTYLARAALLDALTRIAPATAAPVLERALEDADWAVRVRAAELLAGRGTGAEPAARIRPAPTSRSDAAALAPLVSPTYSPQAFIETDEGTIQLELSVLDAPLTVESFIGLARRGFFDGLSFHRVVPNFVVQTGDPRGDGEGGPGFTLRDELNTRAYARGTVGMALDWRDTGGSQFFITHSPQPHLEGRYTVFGHVVAGMDVVDRLAVGDLIRSIRIWDGVTLNGQGAAGWPEPPAAAARE